MTGTAESRENKPKVWRRRNHRLADSDWELISLTDQEDFAPGALTYRQVDRLIQLWSYEIKAIKDGQGPHYDPRYKELSQPEESRPTQGWPAGPTHWRIAQALIHLLKAEGMEPPPIIEFVHHLNENMYVGGRVDDFDYLPIVDSLVKLPAQAFLSRYDKEHASNGDVSDADASGWWYLQIKMQISFGPERPDGSQPCKPKEETHYFYRVEGKDFAELLLRLFVEGFKEEVVEHVQDSKSGDEITIMSRCSFSLHAASEFDEAKRFLIEEELDAVQDRVERHRWRWREEQGLCIKDQVVISGAYLLEAKPPLYPRFGPERLYDQAKNWEEKLRAGSSPLAPARETEALATGMGPDANTRGRVRAAQSAKRPSDERANDKEATQAKLGALSEQQRQILICHQEAEKKGLKPPSYRTIAKILDVSHETVRRQCKEIERITGAPLPGRDKDGARCESSVPPDDLDKRPSKA